MKSRATMWCAIVCTACLCASAVADARQRLVIGTETDWVFETREMVLRKGRQTLVLDGLPETAQMDSLLLAGLFKSIEVVSWKRGADGKGRRPPVWSPSTGFAAVPGTAPATMRWQADVISAYDGPQMLYVVYALDGLRWKAAYHADIRTAPQRETAQVDFTAHVTLWNDTAVDFNEAQVLLNSPSDVPVEAGMTGFVDLPETHALYKRIHPRERTVPPNWPYRLPEPVTLRSGGETVAHLVSMEKLRARKVFVLRSDRFPLSLLRTHTPLEMEVTLDNTAANGLGVRLPPGSLDIRLRGRPLGGEHRPNLPHTEPGRPLRLSLGDAVRVTGYRRQTEQSKPRSGTIDKTYEVVIANRLPYAVALEVDEKPPTNLKWDLLSCSHAHENVGQRLLFKEEVGADTVLTINYRIKEYRPEW